MEFLNTLNIPFMALMKYNNCNRYVSVYKIENDWVYLSDSHHHDSTCVQQTEFIKHFTKHILYPKVEEK
jgi:ABC-type bacteriocin/lantibiotic exporter with double-glycine peptidase domain